MKLKGIVISFAAAVFILSIAVGLINYYAAVKVIGEDTKDSMLAIAESRAEHIETYLESLEGRMVDFSSDGKIKDCLSDISRGAGSCTKEAFSTHLLVNKLPAIEGLETVFALDTEGTVVGSSAGSTGINKGSEAYFLQGLNRPFVTVDFKNKTAYLVVSAPVHRTTGGPELLGVIVGEISTDSLGRIIKDRTGMGETGEVLASVSRSGAPVFLFERRFEQDAMEPMLSGYIAEPTKQALWGNEAVFENSMDYRYEPVIAVSQYISIADLGLVAKIDRSEAIYPHQVSLLQNAIISAAFILIIAAAFMALLASSLLKPLAELRNGAGILSRGNLDYRVKVKEMNEIGELAIDFNNMAEKLESSREKITESEKKLRLLFDNAPDAIFVADPKTGILIDCNKQAEALVGRTREHIIGMHQSKLHPPGEAEKYKAMFRDDVAAGRSVRYDAEIARRNGEKVPVSIGAAVIKIKGKPVIIGIFKDLTQIRKLEQAGKQIFINTSHELKTPLTPIIIQAEMLRNGELGKLTSKQEKSLGLILRNMERLNSLISDILEISRIQAGGVKLNILRQNLKKTADEAVESFIPYSKKVGLRLASNIKDMDAYFDEARIKEVLVNIIDNALKFTPSGTITLSAKKRKKDILVSVRDTGIGIAKKDMGKLFSPFSQIEPSYALRHKGTGLGLSICRALIDLHCGKMWAESAGKGRGSTFYFTLPLNWQSLNRGRGTDKKEDKK